MTLFQIRKNEKVAAHTYELRLEGNTENLTRAGQFVNLAIPGYFLRRPLSPADWDAKGMRLFYKVVGHGTETLCQMQDGKLDVLTGLGNGFDKSRCKGLTPVLIGGGVGVPPLFRLAKEFVQEGIIPLVILGFQSAEEFFLVEDFQKLGANVRLSVADGSVGTKGLVTDVFATYLDDTQKKEASTSKSSCYVYACGPMPMFRALAKIMNEKGIDGSFSLEERMGCGLGICLGCSVETRKGTQTVCKDGPVFPKEVLPWANEA